jgi:flagellar M-ring protein FliF
MAENTKTLEGAAGQITQFLRELSIKQQLMLVGAALAVASTLFIFVRLMGSPDMKPLFTGMKPEDAQQLASKLAAHDIRHQVSADGSSILVANDQLDEARLETASQGMPRSGRLGFELFDKPNWGGSDFSEKVNYQRALEGELERTIQTLRDVEAVRVHLVVPPDSVFVERERAAKASVTLRLRGGHLNPNAQVAIANLVAGAVDRLTPENVVVIDAESNRPLGGSDEPTGGSGKLEDRLAQRLLETLEPVVGHSRIRANVHVENDLSSSEETQESYDPNTTVALTMQRTEERSGSGLTGGIPGTSSNVPGASGSGIAKATVDDGSQSSKSESGTYAVNRLVRHTLIPSGRVKRITAALLVDDEVEQRKENGKSTESRRKRTPEELKQIEELARASLGLDTSRGDTISVQNLAFESLPVETPVPPSVRDRIQTVVLRWSSLLRYLGILLLFVIVYALFLRPVKRQVLALLRDGSLKPAARLQSANAAGQIATSGPEASLEADARATELSRLKRQLTDKAKAEPASTSRLLQSWLREKGNA